MHRLLFFGDSWPHGDELKPGEQPFPDLVAKTLGCWRHNYSQSSTSIAHLVPQLRYAITHSAVSDQPYSISDGTCSAVFFLTSPIRDMRVYSVDNVTHYEEINAESPRYTWYYKNWQNSNHDAHKTNVIILALLQLCSLHNIQPYFVWGWDSVDLWPEIDSEIFYPKTCLHMFDPLAINLYELQCKQDPHIWPNQGHPNQLGHQVIARYLADWLNTKLT